MTNKQKTVKRRFEKEKLKITGLNKETSLMRKPKKIKNHSEINSSKSNQKTTFTT